jgi:hypothetical protein
VDACLGVPFGIGRFILDIVPEVRTFEGLTPDSDVGFDIQDISDALEQEGRAMDMEALTNIMEKLKTYGNIKQNPKTKRFFKRVDASEDGEGINWSRMVDEAMTFMRMSYPEQAGEYESVYCTGKGLEYVHPFTGVTMSLITDKKVREDAEDELLNTLNERFEHLTLTTIEYSIEYFKSKAGPNGCPPKAFFMNDVPRRVGMVDTDQLSDLYEELKEVL